jgi:hypothetical protein
MKKTEPHYIIERPQDCQQLVGTGRYKTRMAAERTLAQQSPSIQMFYQVIGPVKVTYGGPKANKPRKH